MPSEKLIVDAVVVCGVVKFWASAMSLAMSWLLHRVAPRGGISSWAFCAVSVGSFSMLMFVLIICDARWLCP